MKAPDKETYMNKKERNEELELVIEKYSDMLFKICFLILKNEQDVKDVLQETFIKYITKRPDFKSEEHRKAWLIKVSQNKCKEFLRFHKKHAWVPLDEVENSVMITDGMDVETKETISNIWNLDYKLKSVVILYYIEGYSIREVSDLLSISEAAVKKRLQRAREKLKLMDNEFSGGMVYD